MADYPGRFGVFATLPLPDVDGSLREIEYAYDTLKADGVCFMSSYQGKYLGDPAFAPVMEELNRRRAVAYTHPFRAECCVNLLPNGRALGITLSTETTMTIASVLYSGTAAKFPDIRFIWSHGGGTMPYITGRFGVNADTKTPEMPNGVLYEIRKFYYDTAQAFNEHAAHVYEARAALAHPLRHRLPLRTRGDRVTGPRRVRVQRRRPARHRSRQRGYVVSKIEVVRVRLKPDTTSLSPHSLLTARSLFAADGRL